MASITDRGTCVPAGPSMNVNGLLLCLRCSEGNWLRMAEVEIADMDTD
jgi:hypothetical protein